MIIEDVCSGVRGGDLGCGNEIGRSGNGKVRYTPIGFHSGDDIWGGLRRFYGFSLGMAFYEEKQPWGTSTYTIGKYESFQTEKQKVEILTNPIYGQMLFLDGVLQSTTKDQELYHEALSSLIEKPRRVLIGGSAEGWLAQKVLKRPGVHSVIMVDWDRELVEYIKENTDWSPGIWKDSRFRYSSKDIINFLEETTLDFDSIYLDLLDVNTEEEQFLMTHILHWACQKILYPGNTLAMNVGRDKSAAEAWSKRDGFESSVHEIWVPSFQEPWYLVKLVRL